MNILSLSSLIPEQICDTVRFFGYPGQRRISHYCGYAAEFASRVAEDDEIDGAVFPRTCDSARVLPSYIGDFGKLGGYQKFIYQLGIPVRSGSAAAAYLADSLRDYRSAVERHYGERLLDVGERARMVNARNRSLAAIYGELPNVSYEAYLNSIHGMLQTPLAEQEAFGDLPPAPSPSGPRVFVIGSTQAGTGLVGRIEGAGMNIVGDRLPESRRMIFAPPASPDGDVFQNIAESVLCSLASPTRDDFSKILEEDRAELEEKGVRGVVFLTQKYCEPYDFLYPAYKKMLDGMGIRSLRVPSTGSGADNAGLAVEAFAEML